MAAAAGSGTSNALLADGVLEARAEGNAHSGACDDPESLRRQGNTAFASGDTERALELYGAAWESLGARAVRTQRTGCVAGGNADAAQQAAVASNQAACLLLLGRNREAEERSSAALAADPSHCKALFRRGTARLQLGELAGATEDLAKAARLDPSSAEIRERLADALTRGGATGSAACASDAMAGGQEPPANKCAEGSGAAFGAGAGSAIGGPNGGLYAEKADLNEGRLAETHAEQRGWVASVGSWEEIQGVSFAEDERGGTVSVYMALPGVQDLQPNKVCVWFTRTSLEVRVIDLGGRNWVWLATELWGQVDPERCSYKTRRDKLSIKLARRASARSFDRWEKLRRI